jgi:hypothetical protein
MKQHLRVAMTLIVGANPGVAAQLSGLFTFRVEKGDTYTNLFGQDWEKAYRQNKVTVIRGGRPVTSPDILVEGSEISVTGDVRLTARASARVAALNKRRAELRARLTAFAPKLAQSPEALAAMEDCRRILDNDVHFGADVEFASGEVARLEFLVHNALAPQPAPQPARPWWWIALAAFVGVPLAIAIFWKRLRPRYPEGTARYREAFDDVKAAFKATGLVL